MSGSANCPVITIVTPSFNQAEFLEATIESVLSQGYPALEYIIVDGGSTDGSVEIIKKYEKHLQYWCSEPDRGQHDAINKGFAHSKGEIMAWLNSDDMYCPWCLRTVGTIMRELPEVQWLSTLQPAGWDWHGFSTGFAIINGFSRDAFLEGRYLPSRCAAPLGWIQQESTFWRRSLWEASGGQISPELKLAGDFDLWSRFFLHAELYGVASPLGGFRSRVGQKSSAADEYANEAETTLSRMRSACGWRRDSLRSSTLGMKLHRLPRVKQAVAEFCGYSGKRILRANLTTPQASWMAEPYKFI